MKRPLRPFYHAPTPDISWDQQQISSLAQGPNGSKLSNSNNCCCIVIRQCTVYLKVAVYLQTSRLSLLSCRICAPISPSGTRTSSLRTPLSSIRFIKPSSIPSFPTYKQHGSKIKTNQDKRTSWHLLVRIISTSTRCAKGYVSSIFAPINISIPTTCFFFFAIEIWTISQGRLPMTM